MRINMERRKTVRKIRRDIKKGITRKETKASKTEKGRGVAAA